MAGIENNIVFGGGFRLEVSSSRDISDMQKHATDVSNINHTGDPEGVVSANPSSLSHDSTTGFIYIKVSGTGNTGWERLSGFLWIDKAASFAASSNTGYFVTAIATATLPASPSQGDVVKLVSLTASVVTIQANTGQFIRLATAISASAGTAASTRIGDSMDLVYRAADTTWYSIGSPTGTWTIT